MGIDLVGELSCGGAGIRDGRNFFQRGAWRRIRGGRPPSTALSGRRFRLKRLDTHPVGRRQVTVTHDARRVAARSQARGFLQTPAGPGKQFVQLKSLSNQDLNLLTPVFASSH